MEELRTDILPRLITYTDNPVLLVEESHKIGEGGNLFRKEGSMYRETGTSATSYYGFLESIRMMGVDVVTVQATTDLMPTVWFLISIDKYLSHQHYPKPIKSFKPQQIALGMMCCIPGIGLKRAQKALDGHSVKDLTRMNTIEGLTKKQALKVKSILEWK